MSTKKPRPDRESVRAADRMSLQDMLANPAPVVNVAAVGASPAAQEPEPKVLQSQVTEEPEPQPALVAQVEVVANEVAAAPAPAPVAQAVEPAPAQPQPAQEPTLVSDVSQNPMAALVAGMLAPGQLNPEFLKECNVSTPLDPHRAQLLKLAAVLTKKSGKAIMTEALDLWLIKHGYMQPPQ